MKLLRISAIRAIAAVVVGVLLLKYSSSVLKGLIIALGILFLVAGLVSLIGWINSRRQKMELRAFNNGQASQDDSKQPMFPIVGLGSLLLGCMLSLLHTDEFLVWALYLIGAVLILGALNMFMNLYTAKKMEPIAPWMWVLPAVIIAAAVFVMVKEVIPDTSADVVDNDSSPSALATTILGVTTIVYALIELVFSFVLYNIKKRFEKTQVQVRRATAAEKETIKATDLVP